MKAHPDTYKPGGINDPAYWETPKGKAALQGLKEMNEKSASNDPSNYEKGGWRYEANEQNKKMQQDIARSVNQAVHGYDIGEEVSNATAQHTIDGMNNNFSKQHSFANIAKADADYGKASQTRLSDYKGNMEGYNRSLDSSQGDWLKNTQTNEGRFQNDQQQLKNQATTQGQQANATYTNTIQPNLKKLMEDGMQQASQAMSLKDAGDPNNSVNTAWRGLYEQNIQGERNQGYQDYGVLSALGNQASQNTGGSPMTVGQQMAMNAANNRSASEAFAKTQQRINSLRDTGMQVGREESAAQYGRGVDARERASRTTDQFFGSEGEQMNRMAANRGEVSGFGQSILGSQNRVNDAGLGVATDQYGRQTGSAREMYGLDQGLASEMLGRSGALEGAKLGDVYNTQAMQQATADRNAQMSAAEQASRNAMMSSLIGGAATIGGAAIGGPMGAAIGGTLAGSMTRGGQAMTGAGQQPIAANTSFYQPPAGVYNQMSQPYQQSRYGLGVNYG